MIIILFSPKTVYYRLSYNIPIIRWAPNAQYWLAESIYAQKKYDLAIKEFETVRKKYSKSPKARAALLKIGFAQIEKGDLKSGRSTLNQVIKSYGKSEEADIAREKLKELDTQ